MHRNTGNVTLAKRGTRVGAECIVQPRATKLPVTLRHGNPRSRCFVIGEARSYLRRTSIPRFLFRFGGNRFSIPYSGDDTRAPSSSSREDTAEEIVCRSLCRGGLTPSPPTLRRALSSSILSLSLSLVACVSFSPCVCVCVFSFLVRASANPRASIFLT